MPPAQTAEMIVSSRSRNLRLIQNLLFAQHAPNWNHRKQGRHLIPFLQLRIVLIVQSHKGRYYEKRGYEFLSKIGFGVGTADNL